MTDQPTGHGAGAVSTGLSKDMPERIWPGKGTAFYLRGHAQGRSRLKDVRIETSAASLRMETRMEPGYSVLDHCCRASDPGACLMSGFTSLVRVEPGPDEAIDWQLSARFKDDGQAPLGMGMLHVDTNAGIEPAEITFNDTADAQVVICMAIYEPDPETFQRQVDSIRAQTHGNWHCIVNDDHSSPDAFDRCREIIGDDARFSIYRNDENLGFYRNFEQAMLRVPADVAFVALADQDDDWYPDKLERCLAAFGPATSLVYCDMRVVDEQGGVMSETYWSGRRNNYQDAHVLFLANTVTGAASVFRRSLLDDILPFPEPVGQVFHDHWIACVARCRGPLGYVDEALYDYYQYGDSVIGHCDFEARSIGQRLRTAMAGLGRLLSGIGRLKAWLLHQRNSGLNVYRYEYQRLHLFRAILLMRMPMMMDDARTELDMFADGWRGMVRLLRAHWRIMRSGDTTDDAELRLAGAVLIHTLDRFHAHLFARRIVARHCREHDGAHP